MSDPVDNQAKPGMPTWLRILLVVLALCFLAAAALIFAAGSWFSQMGKQAINPENAKTVANELVTIPQLPDGWKYAMGVNMGIVKMASVVGPDKKVVINFIELPNPKHQSAESLSTTTATAGSGKFSAESSGKEMLGGKEMYYQRGVMHTAHGDMATEQGLINTKSDKALLLQIMEPEASKFDLAPAKPLLDQIKGFPQ